MWWSADRILSGILGTCLRQMNPNFCRCREGWIRWMKNLPHGPWLSLENQKLSGNMIMLCKYIGDEPYKENCFKLKNNKHKCVWTCQAGITLIWKLEETLLSSEAWHSETAFQEEFNQSTCRWSLVRFMKGSMWHDCLI